MAASSSSSEIFPESWQVFINFRGAELRDNFVSHLEGALTVAGIKYYIDTKEVPSEDLSVLFSRIEQSEIALSIFSSKYAESNWCLDELAKIMEQVNKGKMRIIPVFFNVTPEEVREQKGEFGLKLYGESRRKRPNVPIWENALQSVPSKIGLNMKNYRNERELVVMIVDSIQRVLALVGKDTFSIQNIRSSKIPISGMAPPYRSALPQYQVFINSRSDEFRSSFIRSLVKSMRLGKINVFIYNDHELRRTDHRQNHLKKIEESRVALAIFSDGYTESPWCMDELVKMKELMGQGKLIVIPVYYRIDISACIKLEGTFGQNFASLQRRYQRETERIQKWKEAFASVSKRLGFAANQPSDDSKFVRSIVEGVTAVLSRLSE